VGPWDRFEDVCPVPYPVEARAADGWPRRGAPDGDASDGVHVDVE